MFCSIIQLFRECRFTQQFFSDFFGLYLIGGTALIGMLFAHQLWSLDRKLVIFSMQKINVASAVFALMGCSYQAIVRWSGPLIVLQIFDKIVGDLALIRYLVKL